MLFQSTPPRRRRHGAYKTVKAISKFQSTPPRRRRPLVGFSSSSSISISIHASAKEATIKKVNTSVSFKFQSTPPRRRRHYLLHFFGCSVSISIHASAKEATLHALFLFSKSFYFNPRLREGGDIQKVIAIKCIYLFQSTPPRRRRQVFILHYGLGL